jgi:MFS transporter, UMF1 family
MAKINRSVFSWCLYDWANSAFATTVMAGFFPGFFKKFWCVGVVPAISTSRLGFGDAIGGLAIAVLAPVLGALAGTGRAKKPFLVAFALLGAAMTACLSRVGQGSWVTALTVYVLAWVGFTIANLFYDSLLTDVAVDKRQFDTISSRGFALGYLGGGLLFVANVLMYQFPGAFGITSPASAVRWSFMSVAVWWFLFSIPLVAFVHQRREAVERLASSRSFAGEALADLGRTAAGILKNRTILVFLIAYWLYIDGVNTVIVMATDFGLSIGIPMSTAMIALVIVQFIAFPASLLFGLIANRHGAKNAILLGILVYAAMSMVGAWVLRTPAHYLVFACIVGLVQGGVQALSRSLFASLVPEDKSAEYFGFYNLVGRFAVVGGPAVVAFTNVLVHNLGFQSQTASRCGMATLSIFFLVGGALLTRVRAGAAR